MAIQGVAADPFFEVLDPLVRAQTLTPDQANEVYRAVTHSGLVSKPLAAGRQEGWTRPSFGVGLGTVGLGLVASAFAISYLLGQDKRGWNTFLGMAAPVLVAAVVFLASGMARSGDQLRHLAATAGSLVIVGVALAIPTAESNGSLYYLSGAIMLLGGLAGYWARRAQIFVVPAVAGGLVVADRLVSRLLERSFAQNDSQLLMFGVLIMLYGVLVVLAGWRFQCRHLAGVLGGAIAIGSLALVIALNGFTGAFFVDPSGQIHTSFRSDSVIALVLGLLVCVGLGAAYAVSRQVGFLVVAALGAAVLPALAVPLLTQKHPVQLAAVFGVVGTLVVAAGVGLARTHLGAAPGAQSSR